MALKVVALFVLSLFFALNSYSADIEIPEGTVVSLEFLDLLSSAGCRCERLPCLPLLLPYTDALDHPLIF